MRGLIDDLSGTTIHDRRERDTHTHDTRHTRRCFFRVPTRALVHLLHRQRELGARDGDDLHPHLQMLKVFKFICFFLSIERIFFLAVMKSILKPSISFNTYRLRPPHRRLGVPQHALLDLLGGVLWGGEWGEDGRTVVGAGGVGD